MWRVMIFISLLSPWSLEQTPEEVEQQDAGVNWDGPIPVLENRESLVVNGLELNANSSLALLKGAAEYLGLNQGGSKKALWNRLNQKVQQLEYEELFLAANKLYKEEARQKGLAQVNIPRQPRKEERELHELTHLPYRDWCDFCVATKAIINEFSTNLLREEETSLQCSLTTPMVGQEETTKPTSPRS